jgi:hypothetical protein
MKKIFVLKERWVLIGTVSIEGPTIQLTDASVVRRWGTTQGLGQIALRGPAEDTIFDLCGSVEFPVESVLFSISCNTL